MPAVSFCWPEEHARIRTCVAHSISGQTRSICKLAALVSCVSTPSLSSPRPRPNPHLVQRASMLPHTALHSQGFRRRAILRAAHLRPDDALDASTASDGTSLARICVSPASSNAGCVPNVESVDQMLSTSLNTKSTKAPGPGGASRAWTCMSTGTGAQHSPAPRTQRSAGISRRTGIAQKPARRERAADARTGLDVVGRRLAARGPAAHVAQTVR